MERILEELTSDVNMGGLQRLLPLKRALTEVEHDIHDAHNAMEQVLNSDENLQALCLEDKTLCSISSSTPNKYTLVFELMQKRKLELQTQHAHREYSLGIHFWYGNNYSLKAIAQ